MTPTSNRIWNDMVQAKRLYKTLKTRAMQTPTNDESLYRIWILMARASLRYDRRVAKYWLADIDAREKDIGAERKAA